MRQVSPDDLQLDLVADGKGGLMVRCTVPSEPPAAAAPKLPLAGRKRKAEGPAMVVRVGVEYPHTPPQAEFPALSCLRVFTPPPPPPPPPLPLPVAAPAFGGGGVVVLLLLSSCSELPRQWKSHLRQDNTEGSTLARHR